ncbi:hypothetical protein BH160DRAFT_0390 [Burkholderia sp. H160]|nr:hypothetical protein BH160DRAFT_0390 [Burkholderia sp. H160]
MSQPDEREVPGSIPPATYEDALRQSAERLGQRRNAQAKREQAERATKANGQTPPTGGGKVKTVEIWEPQVISAAELIASPPEPVRHVIPGLLAPGLAVIAARPKAGKSLLVADWCLSIACGYPVWGRQVERGGALYIDLENSKHRIYQRLLMLHPDQSDVPDMGWVLDWRRGNRAAFVDLLDARPGVSIVALDTWKKFCAVAPRGMDQYDFENDQLQWLAREANSRAIAIIAVLHTVKSPPLDGDPFSAISGSFAVSGNADTLFVLRREGDLTKLYQRGRDSGDTCHVLRLGDDLRFRYVCEGDRMASAEQLRYLQAIYHGQRMPTELMNALGVTRQAVWQMLRRLQADAYLTLPGGIPSLTPMARQMVEAMSERQ